MWGLLPWWLVEKLVWLVLVLAIPVAVGMFPISRLTLKREGWVLTRRVWYSLCVWYICMDFLVVIGGLTWHGWMLSILYLIGVASWVGIATNRQRKPGPHPPQPMGVPIAGVDDFQQLLNKRRQAYAKMVQP
jgi:hypothetical protein